MKKPVGKLRKGMRKRAARRRAIRRGRKGINAKTLAKIFEGMATQEESRLQKETGQVLTDADASEILKRVSSRSLGVHMRLTTKIVLDRMGILNTEAEPHKREEIHELMLQWQKRMQALESADRLARKGEDMPLKWIVDELETKLGGKRRMMRFFRFVDKVNEIIYRESAKLAE